MLDLATSILIFSFVLEYVNLAFILYGLIIQEISTNWPLKGPGRVLDITAWFKLFHCYYFVGPILIGPFRSFSDLSGNH